MAVICGNKAQLKNIVTRLALNANDYLIEMIMAIYYVIADNPDNRILSKASDFLANGEVIVFPTDTNWVLAASLFSKKGLESLYRIKGMDHKKHLSILCRNISDASKYALISDFVYRIIKRLIPGPYTFIFKPTRELPRSISQYRKDQQIGIRIPNSILCQTLIAFCGFPLIASSISNSMVAPARDPGANVPNEIYSYQLQEALQYSVRMIIDPGEITINGPSSVVDFSGQDQVPRIVRVGAGDVSLFL